MSAQARVGLFTLIGAALLFGIFLFWTNFASAANGYRMGVLFDSVAGLRTGSTVFMAGVPVGSVERIDLQPDFKADVILAIKKQYDVPRDATFIVTAPLTGEGTLNIEPPHRHALAAAYTLPPGVKLPPGFKLPPGVATPGATGPTPQPTPIPLWPREILPLDEQPRGTTPASLSELTAQGQATLQKLDVLLLQLQASGPQLAASVQKTVDNAQRLTSDADVLVGRLNTQLASVSTTLNATGANFLALSAELRSTAANSSGKLDSLLTSLNRSSVALNDSLDQLRGLAHDPKLRTNLVQTTANVEAATRTLAELTNDLRNVTGDPQTQAQLRNTVANFDAASQRAASLLGSIGGTSSVYGVDPGATPYPAVSPGAAVPKTNGNPTPGGGAVRTTTAAAYSAGAFAQRLVTVDLRLSRLSPQNAQNPGQNSIFTSDQGPQTDIGATFLPYGKTSFVVGANDIGTSQWTMNVAAMQRFGRNVHIGGGVLYSTLGAMAKVDGGALGFESAIYDPRWPTLDLYGKVTPIKHLQLFSGERDVLHASRRFTYGVQYTTK
jgi:phospholipid/cholesterol/gamma-HCH transport system substrate-binding protein